MPIYNFNNFMENTENFSKSDFIDNNKKMHDQLNTIDLKSCKFKKPKISFKNNAFKKIYNHTPVLPTIESLYENPSRNYIIQGGMRTVGARYPDYIVNKEEMTYLKTIMEKCNIMDIPISNINDVVIACIQLVQDKLKTKLFLNVNDKKWSIFDTMTNSFRNLCLDIFSYSEYKNKFTPTNLSMLLFFTGDCREHCFLLLYLLRIYLHYNDTQNRYLVMPIYTSVGVNNSNDIKQNYQNLYYEHTFPVLIDTQTKKIFAIDALLHKLGDVFPSRENNLFKPIVGLDNNFYKSGLYIHGEHKGKDMLFSLVDWFSDTPCQYTDNKLMKNKVFLYGIPFKRPNIKYVFDDKFNYLITHNLINSKLCRSTIKPFTSKKTKKTSKKI